MTGSARETTPTVVVGVDGSEESTPALAWAARYAQVTGTRLRIVHSWSWQPELTMGAPYGLVWAPKPEDLDAARSAERQRLDALLAAALGTAASTVECVIAEGEPWRVLIEQARDAELLVVGSHHRGVLSGLLLGSTSRACAQHSHCPVVVVPTATEHDRAPAPVRVSMPRTSRKPDELPASDTPVGAASL